MIRDRPQRDTRQSLLGARASAYFGSSLIDLGFSYSDSDDQFRFPIPSGVRETDSEDLTAVLRYALRPDPGSVLPLFEATAQYATGSADRDFFHNLSGTAGPLFGSNELDSLTLSASASLNLPLGDAFTLSPSVAFTRAERDNEDRFLAATRPTVAYSPVMPNMRLTDGAVPAVDTSYRRRYDAWSPALGLSWRVSDEDFLFAAISRSFEAPTHDDLLAAINGTPISGPGRPLPPNPALPAAAFATPDLDAQEATTLELGWRGERSRLSWDATVYFAWLDNELLSLRDENGAQLSAANAGETTHFGVELGLAGTLTEKLTGRVVYTFQDFRFVDDPTRGDNRLAGAPRHWLYASTTYAMSERWSFGGSLRWMMDETPVDNANTVFNDAFAVLDLRADLRVRDGLALFLEITNIADETYASSTLITDQARPDQAVYLPGDGRGFFGGVKLRF